MNRRLCVLVALFVSAAPSFAGSAWKSLLLSALTSPTGTATGIVDDPFAERLRRALHTDADLIAKVSTLKTLPQPGCKRLSIELSIPGETFLRTDGDRMPFVTGFAMNLCPNGLPPNVEEAD